MQNNQMIEVIEQSGLEQKTALNLKESFSTFFEQAQEWKIKADGLIVTSSDQKREMKMAREARLALREIRINADKTRKALKEDSLRYGKAVQGVYNIIEYLIVPIEEHLQKQEDFAKIEEENRKKLLEEERLNLLEGLNEFVPMKLDLKNMEEEDFQKLISGAKLQKQAKEDAEKKAEEERIAKEKAEKEERECVRIENEKLKAEAEAREKQIAEERAKAEKERKEAEEKARKEREEIEAKARAEKAESERKLKAEAEAREKLEREAKEKRETEERAQKEKEEAERKAKSAPDKEKLLKFAQELKELDLDLVSEEAKQILISAKELLSKTHDYILKKCESI